MAQKKKECTQKIWERIEENVKNPDYVKAVYEFIRVTS